MPPIITDFNPPSGYGKGGIKREFSSFPTGYMSCAVPYPDSMLIPEVEFKERLAERKAKGSRMQKLAYDMEPLDQDGRGDCWCFSTTGATQVVRLWQGELHVPLCATAIAWLMKPNSQGGWNAESVNWSSEHGIPPQSLWPQAKIGRQYNTPECQEKALLYKIASWYDGSDDPDKAWHQLWSAILGYDLIGITDFNHWGHSVFTYDVVAEDESTIKNSWGKWGDNGSGNLKGYKVKPNGLIIPCVMLPSEA